MATVKELKEKRANIWAQMQEVMDGATGRSFTAEEDTKYDAAEKDLDKLERDIERQERYEKRKAQEDSERREDAGVVPKGGQKGGGQDRPDDFDAYRDAFTAYLRYGLADLEPEQAKILRGNSLKNTLSDDEFKLVRAAGVATGAAGGFLVSPQFRTKLIETMKTFGGMLNAAEVINTDTGVNLPWPTNDDTANVGAILAENTQVTEQDITLGQSSLDAYMYTSKLVRASLQFLQDSAIDPEAFLARKLGERIGRILNQHFTTGTGTAQPDGIVTSATVGKQGVVGQTTTIVYDDIVDLIESIDPAYQAGAQFMMSTQARKIIRKLKDGQQRPLWEPSIQVGVPDSMLGYGLRLNQDMPSPAASAKTVLFGDFSRAYVIRLVTGVQTMRLTERYADFLQVGFLAFQRADGTLQDPAAVRAYQHSAT